MEKKIRFMLTRAAADEHSAGELRHALKQEAMRLDVAVPGVLRHRRAFRLDDQALREAARGPLYAGSPPFDALMEVTTDAASDLDRAAAAVAGLSARLDGLIQSRACAVMAGTAHDVLPGHGPVHLAICGRRLPHLSHEDYMDHWFHRHSDKARSADQVVEGLYYRQFHADPTLSADIAQRTGFAIADFDGMSETYFVNGGTLSRVYNAPGVWEAALTDELRFVDHSRSVLSLFLMDDRED